MDANIMLKCCKEVTCTMYIFGQGSLGGDAHSAYNLA